MINYDGRRFQPADEPDAGDRVATYRQDGEVLWGEFAGGRARRGALTGTCRADGSLEFTYCMVLESGELISGHCASTPRILDDGRIQLDEVWQRYGPNASTGTSALREVRS